MRKTVTTNGTTNTTYYIRDAQGNTLAVYERNGSFLKWKEQDLYGSSRLGMAKPEREVTGFFWASAAYPLVAGAKSYELSNHLGNVMAVISDRGELQSAQDYYPFGMAIPGRSTTSTYKYGFNGQEKDTEMGGGIYTAEFWQYDARLGRRWNLDPKPIVSISSYACLSNNPIALVDPYGDKVIGAGTDDAKAKNSANEMKKIMQNSFKGKDKADKSVDAVRALFKLEADGVTFSEINMKQFGEAIRDLDNDQKALAKSYLMAINMAEEHSVEFAKRGESISEKSEEVLSKALSLPKPITGTTVDTKFGGGVNHAIGGGGPGVSTRSVIITDSQESSTDFIDNQSGAHVHRTMTVGEIFVHEVIGHGVMRALGSVGAHTIDAIQMQNLYARCMGITSYRDGTEHKGGPHTQKEATGIPRNFQPKK